jgi:molybdopterin-guanine dinucleotide biosynthesis protein A
MGRDKALLPWGGSTLLDLAIDRLRACCGTVGLLCGPDPRYADRGVALVPDLVPGAGPLGAVMSGLAWLRGSAGLFLAVDLPAVPVALLTHLIGSIGDWDAIVPVTDRGPEPLCAVYTSACLEPVQRRVRDGDLKMTSFWPDVRIRKVGRDELAAFGDPDALFHNVNSPGDLTRG